LKILRIRYATAVEAGDYVCYSFLKLKSVIEIAKFFQRCFSRNKFVADDDVLRAIAYYHAKMGRCRLMDFVSDPYRAYLSFVAFVSLKDAPFLVPIEMYEGDAADESEVVATGDVLSSGELALEGKGIDTEVNCA